MATQASVPAIRIEPPRAAGAVGVWETSHEFIVPLGGPWNYTTAIVIVSARDADSDEPGEYRLFNVTQNTETVTTDHGLGEIRLVIETSPVQSGDLLYLQRRPLVAGSDAWNIQVAVTVHDQDLGSTSAPDFGPLGNVTDLSATPGDGRITLSWTPPGQQVTQGFYRSRVAGETDWLINSLGGQTNGTWTSTGWTNTTDYEFEIMLRNQHGDTAWSNQVSVTPTSSAQDPPDVITNLAVSAVGNGTLSVDWTVPADNGDPITFYDGQAATNAGFTTGLVSVTDSNTKPMAFTGLTNETVYYMRVRAKNATGGNAPWSNVVTSTPTSGVTAPAAVTDLTAIPGDTEVTLMWSAPSNGGATITGYRITRQGQTIATQHPQPSYTDTGLVNGTPYTYRVFAINSAGEGAGSNQPTATPLAPTAVTDPNPIPTETTVRYASPTGTGGGTTSGDPMSYTAGMDWIDDTAPAGGTLRLLAGTYSVSEYSFNNGRTIGQEKANYRVVRSDDLDNPAVLECSQAGYGGFVMRDGANRICFYGLEGDGNCTSVPGQIPRTAANYQPTAAEPGADGAQQFIRLGHDSADQNSHHIWVKQCKMHHFYTGGVTSIGQSATTSECFLVEDCQFWNNAHGPHYGGSGVSILYPKAGLTDGQIDSMFKPTVDGATRICGFIFRRNIGYRNYQVHESPANGTKTASDGNLVTTDYWNPEDYEGSGFSTQNYNRAALIENNVSFGNGRMYAATYTHPSGGVWYRFNTSSHDGITYRHIETAASIEATPIGGKTAGGWNDVFRVDANLIIIDPAMNNPNAAEKWICVDGYTGGLGGASPSNPPLRTDWNVFVLNAGYTVGNALTGHTNTVTTDPGLGTPPDYLTDNGEIPIETIKTWATPTTNSSATQGSCPHAPSDGVDAFWNIRAAGSVGAVVPGGTGAPPPPSGFKATTQGASQSGPVAMPLAAVAGDTIVYVATRDPAAPGTITAPAGATVLNNSGGGNSTELLVWYDLSWNGTDVPGDFGDAGGGNFSERLIYVYDGTATSVTKGTETGSTPGPAPTWAGVTTAGTGSVIALASTYDITDAPYSKADATFSTDAAQIDWVGVTGLSKVVTAGTHAPSPAGNYAGTGNMTTLMVAVND